MESHGLQEVHPKPVTTPKRYGAGMAHTVASIGHLLYYSYCGLWWITMDYQVSWIIMDYPGLSWIIVHYNGLWTMADYHGLWIMMDYRVLMGLIMDYGLSWTIEDYCGTSRIYYGFSWILKYDHHGIAWITRYTPQASDDT